MKFRTKSSPLLLLLLPSLAAGLAPRAPAAKGDDTVAVVSSRDPDDGSAPVAPKGRHGLPTKDAPVDGKDGKPHLGPFVGTDGAATDSDRQLLPPLKGRPQDPTYVDGKKIPESNDGVMFDKNRERPQEGTTGTEGGVSEKDKARKAKEGQTGEKALAQPESPKEKLPLPHSEEQKLRTTDDKAKEKDKSKQSSDKAEGNTDYTGLDVRPPIAFPPRARQA